jgi:hypothetical protein
MSIKFCPKHKNTFWINYTDCIKNIQHTNRQIKEADNLRIFGWPKLKTLPFNKGEKGVSNFTGSILTILFGTLKNEQIDFLYAFQGITVKPTLLAVSENERILSKEL